VDRLALCRGCGVRRRRVSPSTSDERVLDHTPDGMVLSRYSKGQSIERAVDPADRYLHGGRGTGRRCQDWRVVSRKRPVSTRGVPRQPDDDAGDEDDGSRGRQGDTPLGLDRVSSGVDGTAGGSPTRWVRDCGVG
jgi:hypothetical protein